VVFASFFGGSFLVAGYKERPQAEKNTRGHDSLSRGRRSGGGEGGCYMGRGEHLCDSSGLGFVSAERRWTRCWRANRLPMLESGTVRMVLVDRVCVE
jgi:hypothetical protein